MVTLMVTWKSIKVWYKKIIIQKENWYFYCYFKNATKYDLWANTGCSGRSYGMKRSNQLPETNRTDCTDETTATGRRDRQMSVNICSASQQTHAYIREISDWNYSEKCYLINSDIYNSTQQLVKYWFCLIARLQFYLIQANPKHW